MTEIAAKGGPIRGSLGWVLIGRKAGPTPYTLDEMRRVQAVLVALVR